MNYTAIRYDNPDDPPKPDKPKKPKRKKNDPGKPVKPDIGRKAPKPLKNLK